MGKKEAGGDQSDAIGESLHLPLLVLKMEEGAKSQRTQAPLDAGKGKN